MSAGVSEKPDGSRYVAVGTSEPRGYLRRGVELKPDEVLMPGGEHAEEDVVGGTLALGDKPVAVGAGRPHCPKCVEAIEKASAATASPRRQ
jgi:filamentous hemagglutinin